MVRWLYRPLDLLNELSRRFGDAFTVRIGNLPPLVIISSPEAIKELFAVGGDEAHAGKVNASLRPFLGRYSLLMLDGDEHLRQRRLVLPAFHGERMAAYGKQMLDITDASIDAWPVGRPFAVHPRLQAITLEVILRTIFGVEVEAELSRRKELITELLEVASWPPLLIPYFQVDLGPLSPWGRFVRLRDRADALFYAELAERKREGDRARSDVLALLMEARDEAGAPMSDEELRDELVTLLVAGHETTATALSWALRWISATPGLTERLVDEIATASEGSRLVPERVAKLPLLDATVRETLRLQPVVPLVGRMLQKPARIGGYDLPAETIVMASIYLAQQRPEAYPEPWRFDPDRFSNKKASPYEWLPFGGGIRRCVGMAFALYEMKMVLSATLARVKFRLTDVRAARVERRSITLSPEGGLSLIVERKAPRGAALSAAA